MGFAGLRHAPASSGSARRPLGSAARVGRAMLSVLTLALFTACSDAIRRALAYAGEGTLTQQAYLLRVDGADLLRFQGLATQQHIRVDDAAFALYVVMQVFIRLNAVGLPNAE